VTGKGCRDLAMACFGGMMIIEEGGCGCCDEALDVVD